MNNNNIGNGKIGCFEFDNRPPVCFHGLLDYGVFLMLVCFHFIPFIREFTI